VSTSWTYWESIRFTRPDAEYVLPSIRQRRALRSPKPVHSANPTSGLLQTSGYRIANDRLFVPTTGEQDPRKAVQDLPIFTITVAPARRWRRRAGWG
jgi:hypothetical protein